MVFEATFQYKDSLRIWRDLKDREAAVRSVEIMRRLQDKELIKEFAEWILKFKPELGLTVFQIDNDGPDTI